jgi:hypothetical protein
VWRATHWPNDNLPGAPPAAAGDERGIFEDEVRHHPSDVAVLRAARSFSRRTPIACPSAGADHRGMKLKPILHTLIIACALTSGAAEHVNAQSAPVSEAKKAFARLKTLSGSWKGNIMNMPITATIRPASSGTAILHEMTTDAKGPPQQEITMFYVEDDRLLAVHYCDGNNRVRWEGKMNADGTAIDFTMLDVTGGTKGGLLKRLVFTLTDSDTHAVQALFVMPDGKPVDLTGEFRRTQ